MVRNFLHLRKVAIVACLAGITIFASCEKKENKPDTNQGNNPEAISVANTNSLTQEVFADNQQGSSGVSFTTTGAWTSTISSVEPKAKSG